MPIISRTLTLLGNRPDIAPTMKRWRVDGVDGRGNTWVHGAFFALEGTAAEAIRDAAWPIERLEEFDEQEGVRFVEEGGAPESFVREDLTLVEWRNRLAKRFWRADIDTDRKFLCKIAPYIATFTAVQIATALGITEVKAQKGLDRAIDLRDNVCAAMDLSDADAEEV